LLWKLDDAVYVYIYVYIVYIYIHIYNVHTYAPPAVLTEARPRSDGRTLAPHVPTEN
jgi:hypothetical protein